MNIVLTGGHAGTTGLAVIEEIQKSLKEVSINWIGVKNIYPGSNDTTIEYKIYPEIGVKFYPIEAGKLQTKFTKHTIPLIFKIPLGFFQALILLIKLRPKLILSLGGFASFPVVFWGSVLGIPVIIHEQTLAAGRANLASKILADKILLAHSESLKYFPRSKSIVVGNPLMSSIIRAQPYAISHTPYGILIMGGSRGSEFINDEIIKISDYLKNKFNVIHISGTKDFDKVKLLEDKNYKVYETVDPRKMGELYNKSDLIISRAGANTISEIFYLKKPSILIPLPKTYLDEQVKNAKYLKDQGLATVLLEEDVNMISLIKAIETMIDKRKQTSQKTFDNASSNIVKIIKRYLE